MSLTVPVARHTREEGYVEASDKREQDGIEATCSAQQRSAESVLAWCRRSLPGDIRRPRSTEGPSQRQGERQGRRQGPQQRPFLAERFCDGFG